MELTNCTNEPDIETDTVARKVLGAAIEVHRTLGPGFVEVVYENALCHEMQMRGIAFERQKAATVRYKGVVVGEGRLDVLVERTVILELKAVPALCATHTIQLLSYLKATGLSLGLVQGCAH